MVPGENWRRREPASRGDRHLPGEVQKWIARLHQVVGKLDAEGAERTAHTLGALAYFRSSAADHADLLAAVEAEVSSLLAAVQRDVRGEVHMQGEMDCNFEEKLIAHPALEAAPRFEQYSWATVRLRTHRKPLGLL